MSHYPRYNTSDDPVSPITSPTTRSPYEASYTEYSELRPLGAQGGTAEEQSYVERGDALDVQRTAREEDERSVSLQPRDSVDLQTNYSTLNLETQRTLSRQHNPNHQLLHLLSKATLRFLATAALIATQASIFLHYSRLPYLTTQQKKTVNFLKTLAYLCIGLNVAGSFKSVSLMLRWKLLARRKHNLRDVDSILGLASLIKCCGFAWRCMRSGRWGVAVGCVAWVVFNCIGRTSIALTGLCYSQEAVEVIRTGEVHLPNLEFITKNEDRGLSLNRAHTIASSAFLAHKVLQKQSSGFNYLGTPGHIQFIIPAFHNPNANSLPSFIPSPYYLEIRSNCTSWPIIRGGDGKSTTIVYRKKDVDGKDSDITMEGVQEAAPGATVYINPRSDHNGNQRCGDVKDVKRCSRIAALHFVEKGKEEVEGEPKIFDCQVEVSEVKRGGDDVGKEEVEYKLGDESAWVAAGAVGLTGFGEGNDRWDYVRFYRGTHLSPLKPRPSHLANLTSEFAVSALAGLSFFPISSPPYTKTTGSYTYLGEKLIIKPGLWIIYIGILSAQALVAVSAAIYANTVFVKDDSYLSTSRLLRPVVDRLGPSGCALTGKDIAATLGEFVVYGVRSDGSGSRHHLDIGADILAQKRFPLGWYDGEILEEDGRDGKGGENLKEKME